MDNLKLQLAQKELELLQKIERDRELRPFLHYNLYDWQEEFLECSHHKQFLTSANQTGKTFSMQLKAHKMSTDQDWRRKQWGIYQPRMGWYVLPSQDTINDLYYSKWEPEILAKGEHKESGPYAWRVIKKAYDIKGIYFPATQFTLSFVSLGASAQNLQARTLGFVVFDEEPDISKLGEIEMRCASYNDPETGLPLSLLIFGFTPTSGQEYFKRIFSFNDEKFFKNIPEEIVQKHFPDRLLVTEREAELELEPASNLVWKRRVNMFDCMRFKDGRPGRYTEARIRQLINSQKTEREVKIRIFGSFEKEHDGGKVYSEFDRVRCFLPYGDNLLDSYKKNGFFTAGIDYGSGTNHASAICITWVSNDFKKVRPYFLWKGEKGISTTADDVVKKYIEMTRGLHVKWPFYDWAAADLKVIAQRMGIIFYKAEKNHEIGVNLLNTLMKNNMFEVLVRKDDPFPAEFATECETITHEQVKKNRIDDLSDAVRYSIAGIAHLFNLIELNPDFEPPVEEKVNDPAVVETDRRDWTKNKKTKSWEDEIDEELNDWDGLANGD